MTYIWQGLRPGEWLATAGLARPSRSAAVPTLGCAHIAVGNGYRPFGGRDRGLRAMDVLCNRLVLVCGSGFGGRPACDRRVVLPLRPGEQRLGAILAEHGADHRLRRGRNPLCPTSRPQLAFRCRTARFDVWDRYLLFDWMQMMTLISLHPGVQWISAARLFQLRPANRDNGARTRRSRATRPARHFRRRIRLHAHASPSRY